MSERTDAGKPDLSGYNHEQLSRRRCIALAHFVSARDPEDRLEWFEIVRDYEDAMAAIQHNRGNERVDAK